MQLKGKQIFADMPCITYLGRYLRSGILLLRRPRRSPRGPDHPHDCCLFPKRSGFSRGTRQWCSTIDDIATLGLDNRVRQHKGAPTSSLSGRRPPSPDSLTFQRQSLDLQAPSHPSVTNYPARPEPSWQVSDIGSALCALCWRYRRIRSLLLRNRW